MNNKSITKLLETVAFSNGVYVLWNLYDGNIHISTPQAIFLPESPAGCVVKSSRFSWIISDLPTISEMPKRVS